MVFHTHATGDRSFGALGVPVFFVLSAYLITELLLRESEKYGKVDIGKFYIRRILRIWPLYFFVLIFGYLLAHIVRGHPIGIGMLVPYLLLSGNWFTAFFGYLPLGLGVLWSIGVEEQFYLVWPTIIRIGRRKGALIASAVLFAGSQISVAVLASRHNSINPGIWTNTFAQMQYFAIGAVISVLLNSRIPRFHAAVRVLFLAAAMASFWCADYVFNTSRHEQASLGATYPGYLITGLGAALMFMSFLGAQIPKWMGPFVYFGKISYGLYVFHPLIIEAVKMVMGHHASGPVARSLIALPLTLAVASLSYRFLESPFLNLKHRFETIATRAV
jgi:peptidoglycan/LPS O-acetylase OafA/YrhL